MDSFMDYLDLLEELIDSGKALPFTNKVSVDREKVFNLIGEIRMTVPTELREAQRIIEKHDQYIDDAKMKANSIIREAENSARMMTSQHEIYKRAMEQATDLLEDEKMRARDMRLNAMEYADSILEKIEEILKNAMLINHEQSRKADEYYQEIIEELYTNRQALRSSKRGSSES